MGDGLWRVRGAGALEEVELCVRDVGFGGQHTRTRDVPERVAPADEARQLVGVARDRAQGGGSEAHLRRSSRPDDARRDGLDASGGRDGNKIISANTQCSVVRQ